MSNPDNYHNESSLEIQDELASRKREDQLERRAEPLRAQQQDLDDREEDDSK